MPRATPDNTTHTPDVPRTLRHLETDEQWRERSVDSKLQCTADEAAQRLRGLADTLYGIGLNTGHRLHEMLFLGAAASDIALALERAMKAKRAVWETAVRKPPRKTDAKPRKRSGRRASA
jgi:hypothetical protein